MFANSDSDFTKSTPTPDQLSDSDLLILENTYLARIQCQLGSPNQCIIVNFGRREKSGLNDRSTLLSDHFESSGQVMLPSLGKTAHYERRFSDYRAESESVKFHRLRLRLQPKLSTPTDSDSDSHTDFAALHIGRGEWGHVIHFFVFDVLSKNR